MYLPVFILAIGAFAIGLAIFMSAGIIPEIALQYAVDEHTAGLALTLYSAGVVIGAPTLTFMNVNVNKKKLVVISMIMFALFNSFVAFSPTFTTFLINRFLSGMFQGLYLGVGIGVAMRLLPERAGFATMIVFLGITLSIALGVPVGSVLADMMGVTYSYLMISFMAIITAIGVALTVPYSAGTVENRMSLKEIFEMMILVLTHGKIMYSYFLTILAFGYLFIAYTFVKPLLRDVSNMPDSLINIFLLLFGVGVVIGNFMSGQIIEKFQLRRPLLWGAIIGIIFCFIFVDLIQSHNPYIIGVVMFFWGMVCYYMTPILQTNAMKFARSHGHQVATVASSLNISSYNIGIALFSYLGANLMVNKDFVVSLIDNLGFSTLSQELSASPNVYLNALALLPLSIVSFIFIAVFFFWTKKEHSNH